MATLVVPFRGADGKSRLAGLVPEARAALLQAMLADVLQACFAVGPTFVVAPPGEFVPGARLVADPGGGQGSAVRAGLAAAEGRAPFLVVNADLPCVTPEDLSALADAVPEGGLAIAAAPDGTTNALALSSRDLFAPVYGPGSAERFAELGASAVVDLPNLADDVDSRGDLERLYGRLGSNTRRAAPAVFA